MCGHFSFLWILRWNVFLGMWNGAWMTRWFSSKNTTLSFDVSAYYVIKTLRVHCARVHVLSNMIQVRIPCRGERLFHSHLFPAQYHFFFYYIALDLYFNERASGFRSIGIVGRLFSEPDIVKSVSKSPV